MSTAAALDTLPNIGPKIAKQLKQAGISTPARLAELGSREAWLRLQMGDPSACYNCLCALEGALQGVRWHALPVEDKRSLLAFYNAHKQQ